MTEIVFLHGALVRDGDWWWAPAAAEIRRRSGIRSRSVLLPTCGETEADAASATLADDAGALQSVLDELQDAGDDAILVGHSYGGTVAAEGAQHPAVRALVLISSYLPAAGTAQGQILADEPDPVAVAPGDDGLLHVAGMDAASFAERFLQDVPEPAARAAAWSRVVPQAAGAFVTPTTREAWRGIPTTYLVCTDDRSTTVGLQREHASRATHAIELPTGHHPFLSRPDLVADTLLEVVAELP